jgi:hypothetical protein
MADRVVTCTLCRSWYESSARDFDARLRDFESRGWLAIATPRDRPRAGYVLTLLCPECVKRIHIATLSRELGTPSLTIALHMTRRPATTTKRRPKINN